MSFASVISPFDPDQEDLWAKGRSRLAQQLWEACQFLRGLRIQMRYGELSRAPLQLLHFQMRDGTVECDWLARLPDAWDADLSLSVRQRHTSLQALKDAIDMRSLLFDALPQVETARFRVYRESACFTREMIITGFVQRNDHTARNIHSLVMRAKVLGFTFFLEGNTLHRIPTDKQTCVQR
jgi:hypothetical protein